MTTLPEELAKKLHKKSYKLQSAIARVIITA